MLNGTIASMQDPACLALTSDGSCCGSPLAVQRDAASGLMGHRPSLDWGKNCRCEEDLLAGLFLRHPLPIAPRARWRFANLVMHQTLIT